MYVATYSNVRKNLKSFIDKVNDDSEVIIIATDDGRNAVMISEEEYNSIVETFYLTSHFANNEHITNSLEELNTGKRIVHSIR